MDLMTAIQAIPGVGPVLPYIVVAGLLNAVAIAPSLAPPSSQGGFYAFLYRALNALAGNFGHAKNATAPTTAVIATPNNSTSVN